ncbi:MAG: hypothetical protein ABIQ14_01225 [Candidatus Saccharimonadales bacterium]
MSELSDVVSGAAYHVSVFATPRIIQDSIRYPVMSPELPSEFIDHIVHGDGSIELITATDNVLGRKVTKLIVRKNVDNSEDTHKTSLIQLSNREGWISVDDKDSATTFTNHAVVNLIHRTTDALDGQYIDPNMADLGEELHRVLGLQTDLARQAIRMYASDDVIVDSNLHDVHPTKRGIIRVTSNNAVQDMLMISDALYLPDEIKVSRALRFSNRKPHEKMPTSSVCSLQFSSKDLSTDALRLLVDRDANRDKDYAGVLRKAATEFQR